jgi:hypothetical protein
MVVRDFELGWGTMSRSARSRLGLNRSTHSRVSYSKSKCPRQGLCRSARM